MRLSRWQAEITGQKIKRSPWAAQSIFMTSPLWEVPPMIIWSLQRVNFYPLVTLLSPRGKREICVGATKGWHLKTESMRTSVEFSVAGALCRNRVQAKRTRGVTSALWFDDWFLKWYWYLFKVLMEVVMLRDSCFGSHESPIWHGLSWNTIWGASAINMLDVC